MYVRSAALIAACFFAAVGSSSVLAQTQTMGLDECRSAAIGKGLVGDARNKSINDCVGRPVVKGVTTASGSRFATCRSEARAKSLSGDALNTALDDCMAQSGTVEASGTPTFQDCRGRAIARGLVGDARGEFIDSCLTE